jgi:hypothetical protein
MQEEMARVWEENERLKAKIKFLRKELSFIYDINHKNLGERIRKNQELDDYKSRCEKASKYIKKNNFHYMNEYALERFRNDLLNILQNGSDE